MKPILLFSFALALLACSGNENDFDATGTFESTEIIVSSEANGKIMELNLQEGDRLEAGAVLGYVDSTQLYLRKKQLEAGLRSVDIRKPDIRKQIASLEQQIAVARSEQQRMENLVKAKAGNQKQVADIVNNIRRGGCRSGKYRLPDHATGRPVAEKPHRQPEVRHCPYEICRTR